jgi:hypothetical protein
MKNLLGQKAIQVGDGQAQQEEVFLATMYLLGNIN